MNEYSLPIENVLYFSEMKMNEQKFLSIVMRDQEKKIYLMGDEIEAFKSQYSEYMMKKINGDFLKMTVVKFNSLAYFKFIREGSL